MLNQYKNMCANVADSLIPDWRTRSKGDLLNSYLKEKDTQENHTNPTSKLNGYIAALLYKYWGKIESSYYKSYTAATKEDCFAWVSRAIMYALCIDKPEETQHRTPKWTQKLITRVNKETGEEKIVENPLYGDPSGPDRTVTTCISGERAIFYQSSNYPIRKGNVANLSIQGLEESKLDYILPKSTSNLDMFDTVWIHSMVRTYFERKEYIKGLIIDSIINGNVFCKSDKSFKLSRVKSHIIKFLFDETLDSKEYVNIFFTEYDIDINIYEQIKNSKEFVKSGKLKPRLLNKLIEVKFEELKTDLADALDRRV